MSPALVTSQLHVELGAIIRALGAVLGSNVRELAGWRLECACHRLAAELCSEDDQMVDEAASAVMSARWPDAEPTPQWWRTPVGRLVARSMGGHDTAAVTHSVAAAMLGVTRGTVAQLVHRGTLDRHPDGGVARYSVLTRIGRQATPAAADR